MRSIHHLSYRGKRGSDVSVMSEGQEPAESRRFILPASALRLESTLLSSGDVGGAGSDMAGVAGGSGWVLRIPFIG
jgi:hypothetical protein